MGTPSNIPPTFPWLARNSSMIPLFQSWRSLMSSLSTGWLTRTTRSTPSSIPLPILSNGRDERVDRAPPDPAPDRGTDPGGLGRGATGARRPHPPGRVRPGVAGPVPSGGGAGPAGARREGAAARAHRVDVRAGPGRQADHRHMSGARRYLRRSRVRPGARGGRVHAVDPRARLVRAPAPEGAGHGCEPARLSGRMSGDRALPAVQGPAPVERRRPRALRAGEAGAGPAEVEVCAELRRRQERGGRSDHLPGPHGLAGLRSPTRSTVAFLPYASKGHLV